MLPEKLIYLAALIHFSAACIYIRETLRGESQPNRVTWFIWALAPLTATAAQVYGHGGPSSLVVFSSGFGPLLVFCCSFASKKAYWKTNAFDYICGSLALIGLIIWYLTRDQNYAILFSILSDGLAALPTFRKAYTHPESESGPTYIVGGIATLLTLCCIQHRTFTAYAFTIYLFLLYVVLSVLIYRIKFSTFLRKLGTS